MPVWALMDYDEEVAMFSGISNSVERGVALAPGVHIVCIEDC